MYRGIVSLCGACFIRVGVMEKEKVHSSHCRRGLMW